MATKEVEVTIADTSTETNEEAVMAADHSEETDRAVEE